MDGGYDLARTELSAKPDAANMVPSAGLYARSCGFACLNLGFVGNFRLHHAGLNLAANLGQLVPPAVPDI